MSTDPQPPYEPPPGYPPPDGPTRRSSWGLIVLAVGLLMLAAVAAVLAVRHGSAAGERAMAWIAPPPTTLQVDPPYAELPGGVEVPAFWDATDEEWKLPPGCHGHRVFVRIRYTVSATDIAAHPGKWRYMWNMTDGKRGFFEGRDHYGERTLDQLTPDGTIVGSTGHHVPMGNGGAIVHLLLRVKPAAGGDTVMVAARTLWVKYSD